MPLRFLLGLATCLQCQVRHKAHYHGYSLPPCAEPLNSPGAAMYSRSCSSCHGWGHPSVCTGSSMVPGFKFSVVITNICFSFPSGLICHILHNHVTNILLVILHICKLTLRSGSRGQANLSKDFDFTPFHTEALHS